MSSNSFINKLVLNNFRNFENRKFEFKNNHVLFTGKNGSGKTNILESLSAIGRNSNLRGADFEEMLKISQSQFSIFCEITNHDYINNISINFDLKSKKKNLLVNGENTGNKRQSDLKSYLPNFICLTPQLEQLFISGKSSRRDYFDRIVSDLDLSHQNRINDYQKLLKERLLILKKYQQQNHAKKWLDGIENKIVETGIAIASGRIESIEFFNKAINTFNSNFPKTELQIFGEIENLVMKQSSIQIEEYYHQKLIENREQDCLNFKTNFGVHRCDFNAIFCEKNIPATQSSTGEQKAIMIAITIARAKISSQYRNQSTFIILDEIVSHLDDQRKKNLLSEIDDTNLQTFYSATNLSLLPSQLIDKFQEIKVD